MPLAYLNGIIRAGSEIRDKQCLKLTVKILQSSVNELPIPSLQHLETKRRKNSSLTGREV